PSNSGGTAWRAPSSASTSAWTKTWPRRSRPCAMSTRRPPRRRSCAEPDIPPAALTWPVAYAAPMSVQPALPSADRLRARESWATAALVAFAALSAARLAAALVDVSWLARGSQYVLMLTLALWVVARRGPGLLVGALALSGIGDVLLVSGDRVF